MNKFFFNTKKVRIMGSRDWLQQTNTQKMPRFQDSHVKSLVRVMLQRVPECSFTAEDVQLIEKETGLNKAQVLVWGHNVRTRVPPQQRAEYLRTFSDEKEVFYTRSKFGFEFSSEPRSFSTYFLFIFTARQYKDFQILHYLLQCGCCVLE